MPCESQRRETHGADISDRLGGAAEAQEQAVTSHYLKAGSPICCYLPSCRKPFLGVCIHADDGHFYCSHECAEEGAKIDLTHVEPLRARK